MRDDYGIRLGDKGKDKITGFEGVVTGYCEYLTGCNQVLLVPEATNNEFKEGHWFDVDRCEIVTRDVFPPDQVSSVARPGGDTPAPKK